jgi:ribonucleoside-diphosphate reductase alpha chain
MLQRQRPAAGDACAGQERDARQVFRRLAGCWTYWGWKGGYFSSEADSLAFFDETCYMLAAQMAVPKSSAITARCLFQVIGLSHPCRGRPERTPGRAVP